MTDIIDAFVVTLGLDPSQYNSEIKKFREDRKRLDQETTKSDKNQQDSQKRLTEGVRNLRNETAGFLFMLAGASGMTSFVKNMVEGDAATGRLADRLGIATKKLSAWQEAIRSVGGKPGSADQALQAMVTLRVATKNDQIDPQKLAIEQQMRVKMGAPDEMLFQIAQAAERMKPEDFAYKAGLLGVNDDMINFLIRGRGAAQGAVEGFARKGAISQSDADAARAFDAALEQIGTQLRALARPGVEGIAGTLGALMENQQAVEIAVDTGVGLLATLSAGIIAFAAVNWEIVAIGAAITVLVAGIVEAYRAVKGAAPSTPGAFGGASHVSGDVNPTQTIARRGAVPIPRHWVEDGRGRTGNWGHWEGVGSGHLNEVGILPKETNGIPTSSWKVSPQYLGKGPTASGASANPYADTTGEGAKTRGSVNPAYIKAYFMRKGASATEADGMVTAMRAENPHLDPSNTGPDGGTQGLGQWRGGRKIGKGSTADQQLDHFWNEWANGDRSQGLLPSHNSTVGLDKLGVAKLAFDRFFKPGKGLKGDYDRAGIAWRGGGGMTNVRQTTTIGTINITSPAANAPGLAHDIKNELTKRQTVGQANYGLQQ